MVEQPRGNLFVSVLCILFIPSLSSSSFFYFWCFDRAADVAQVLAQHRAPLGALGLVGQRPAGVGGVGADLFFFVWVMFDEGKR